MKKLLYLLVGLCTACAVAACSEKDETIQKWEYKTVSISGVTFNKFMSRTFYVPEEQMNELGAQGWELVDVYTCTETVHPNFGNEEYVTGLQPNTRTEEVIYVFKRPVLPEKKSLKSKDSKMHGFSNAAEEDLDSAVCDTAVVVESIYIDD